MRLFLTGIGCITGYGTGREALWSGLLSGRTAAESPAQAVVCRAFDPAAVIGRREVRRMDRTTQLTVGATRLAFADAGLADHPGEHWGLIGACGLGPLGTTEAAVRTLYQEGPGELSPQDFANSVMNAAAGVASMLYGLKGPGSVLAGGNALAYAVDLLRSGRAEALCVAGGAEYSPTVHRALAECGLLAPEAARPYESSGDGMVVGEAGVALLLETEAHLRRRGGAAYAELLAYSEGYVPTAALFSPAPGGAETMAANIRQVLTEAGLGRSDLDAVFGAGNGVRAVDRAEAEALHAALGGALRETVVTGIKGGTGEAPGAQSLLSVAAAALAIREGLVPPAVGCTAPDPVWALPVLTGQARPLPLRHVLVQTLEQEGEAVSYLLRSVSD